MILVDEGMEYLHGRTIECLDGPIEEYRKVIRSGYYVTESDALEETDEYGIQKLDRDPDIHVIEVDGERLYLVGSAQDGHGSILVLRQLEEKQ